MSEEDVRKEIQRLNDLYIKEIDKKILYSKEVVDCLIDAKTNKLEQENKQLKEELELKSGMNIAVQNLKLIEENKQLKERITYLENSNNRREETIISLRHEQQLDKYKEVIEKVREVIKNEIPYLYEIDKEYENVEGNTYFTYKEYDDSKLLQILDKVKEDVWN